MAEALLETTLFQAVIGWKRRNTAFRKCRCSRVGEFAIQGRRASCDPPGSVLCQSRPSLPAPMRCRDGIEWTCGAIAGLNPQQRARGRHREAFCGVGTEPTCIYTFSRLIRPASPATWPCSKSAKGSVQAYHQRPQGRIGVLPHPLAEEPARDDAERGRHPDHDRIELLTPPRWRPAGISPPTHTGPVSAAADHALRRHDSREHRSARQSA